MHGCCDSNYLIHVFLHLWLHNRKKKQTSESNNLFGSLVSNSLTHYVQKKKKKKRIRVQISANPLLNRIISWNINDETIRFVCWSYIRETGMDSTIVVFQNMHRAHDYIHSLELYRVGITYYYYWKLAGHVARATAHSAQQTMW